MALSRRDVILAGIASFVAWGYAVNWIPALRWAGYAFVAGLIVSVLGVIALVLLTSRGIQYGEGNKIRRPKGMAFLAATSLKNEITALRARQAYQKKPLYPESFVVSSGLDDLLELIVRDFVESWYSNISKNPAFTNEVDNTIRLALVNIRDRLLEIDIVEAVTTRFIPIITAHFKDFYEAERAIRGKNLNRSVTESEELDLAIAARYRDGKLHPAASLAYSDTTLVQQEYLRNLVQDLLPKVLPKSVITSRAVEVLIQELVACAVFSPVMRLMSDPDSWNQIMEAYGRTMLQDRSTVRKLRAALDEHASPAPRSKQATSFPKLSAGDHERRFEKFIRAIRKVNNLSDARRFRSEVSSQLKRDAIQEGQDPVYLRRLEIGKKMLDQRVNQLAATGERLDLRGNGPGAVPNGAQASRLNSASLVDLLHDPSGLSYFMEYMDRRGRMSLVQFWIVVDGFRNPLEVDFADDDEIPASLAPWVDADRTDLAQINDAYLSKPELNVPEKSKQLVRDFLKAGKDATPRQYFFARRAVLQAQTSALEVMQENYFPGFKKSDLFYKCLTSQEAMKSQAPPTSPLAPSRLDDTFHKPQLAPRGSTQVFTSKPSPLARVSAKFVPRKTDIRRAAVSSTDLTSATNRSPDGISESRRSLDETSSPLFDDEDFDSEVMNNSVHSLDQEPETIVPDKNVVQAMEAALNNIMEGKPDVEDFRKSLFGDEDSLDSPNHSLGSPLGNNSTRSSIDHRRLDLFGEKVEKPSIASLGLVNTSSRIGVFTDDDLFPDEEQFLSDEHDDPDEEKEHDVEDDIHEAAPGDLGLAEAITALTTDIDRLAAQDAVVDSLTRKAELTNNTAELRILRKSKASLEREIRRKELQRQQYVIQESDNSLYGRSTVKIKSIMVGKEDDGREFALYVVEVQRKAGEQMPAATWTITRRYSEFHELQQRLRFKYPSVRNLDFPRRRMVMKLQPDFLHKRRLALEKYLRELLQLPEVCRSRELRAFLSQSVIAPGSDGSYDQEDKKDIMTRFYNSVTDGMEDILGNIPVLDQLSLAGQNLISAATSQLMTMPPTISEDPLTAAEAEAELNAFEDREIEPFVKPICDIFLEVFELNRGNNWLRGRAVVVVLHQLLGGTIERKVRENVKALVQEDAIVRYINLLKDSMWPGGKLKRGGQMRSSNEKSKTRKEASLMLATLVPDLAASVVGRINAQAASRRIFATFNNPRLKYLKNLFQIVTVEIEMPHRSSTADSRRQQAVKAERVRKILQGIIRDDSDDELGNEDHPWEWIHENVDREADGDEENEDEEEKHAAARRRRSRPGRYSPRKEKIIGAKMGKFECKIGDCVLLKAEGTSAAWVGIICEFTENKEQEKLAKFMWFCSEKEISNKQKKRADFLPNELYITPTYDENPLETINGTALIMSEKAFNAKYTNGKIPRKARGFGKTFVCRRGCNTRTATYTEEFIWEDVYDGTEEGLSRLRERIENDTTATRKKRPGKRKIADDEFAGENGGDSDVELQTPRKKQKFSSAVSTPRKMRTPSKLVTPSHKRVIVKKPLEFTPLGTRILAPDQLLSSPFQTARSRLHVAAVPATLPCREDEFASVFSHLESAISDASGACIYISGTPGTGKTATVREVIAQLNASVMADELDDFIFVEINGMKVTDPHQSYSLLWEALKGDRVSPSHALDLLEREFSHPSPRRVPCVVLMDELDQLVTKNQSVMYNFFNWPGLRYSKLIVLAVANTMDLPERTLSNKISSRLGLTRITFPGYTHDQLMKIIQSRLEGVPNNMVDSDAIQFASRKVAAVSGDARRALDICRRAVEIAESDFLDSQNGVTPGTPSKGGKTVKDGQPHKTLGKVTIATVKRAINEATTSPLQQFLRALPLSSKVLLAALLAKTRRTGISESILGEVLDEAKRLAKMDTGGNIVEFLLKDGFSLKGKNMHIGFRQSLKAPRVLAIGSSAIDLMEAGIIGLEARKADRTGKIRLSIGEEDVRLAFKDDPEIKRLGFSA